MPIPADGAVDESYALPCRQGAIRQPICPTFLNGRITEPVFVAGACSHMPMVEKRQKRACATEKEKRPFAICK